MSHRARHQLLAFPGIIFLVLFPIIMSLWIAFFWAKSEVNNQLELLLSWRWINLSWSFVRQI